MGTLLENKKNEKCRLNLPEGLRELMSDISREVLRAQPSDICGFIADYLSALLVTRDNLAIASQVYSYVCECEGHPELLSELEAIGLDEGNAEIAQDIIIKYFNKEKVNEGSLLSALLARTNIKASMYPAVVNAVRAAYRRHQAHTATKYVTSPEIEEDQVASAVSHTLRLYRDAEPPDGLYGEMATKIQASYRAYGVRRDIASKTLQTTNLRTTMSESHSEQAATSHSSISDGLKKEIELTASMHRKNFQRSRPLRNSGVNTASSISLAGSICALPTHRPYIAQDIECLSLLEETEKEHARIDYTARSPHVSVISNDGKLVSVKKNKRISFENASEDELYQDETVYEEQIYEATCEEIQDNKEYDDKCSENSEKSISEEIVEIEDLKCEKYDTIEVNKADIEYINVMNMEIDTDSGDDQDLLTTNLDE